MSSHFDGKYYFNENQKARSFKDFLYWMLTRQPTPWPAFIPVEQQKVKHTRVGDQELSVTFIGHSTFLIQINGCNLLTDPVWSQRASPLKFLGPKRVRAPGVKFEDLPPVDMVLLSHNHYDHLDLPTLKKLEKIHHPVFYVSKGNASFLEKEGLTHVEELDWWDFRLFGSDFTLYFVPAQHFSARGLFDRNRTLWGGFVIKNNQHMVYFAGDTGLNPYFKQIRERLGAPTLSLLPIGAFEPRWFMKSVHMNPADAVQAHLILESRQSIGMHFGTFQLTDEGIDVPLEHLQQALQNEKISKEKFQVMKPGESKQFF